MTAVISDMDEKMTSQLAYVSVELCKSEFSSRWAEENTNSPACVVAQQWRVGEHLAGGLRAGQRGVPKRQGVFLRPLPAGRSAKGLFSLVDLAHLGTSVSICCCTSPSVGSPVTLKLGG